MSFTYVGPLRSCAPGQNAGLEVFCLDWEIMLEPTNTLILHLTFGYHQAGINRPILDSLETVWDRAVSLHSYYAVSEAESSRARRFHWDNVPIPGGHTQTCLYGSVRGPVDLAAARLLPAYVSFPAPSTFKVLPQRFSVCLCGSGWGGRIDQGNGASVEIQLIQRANKNRGQCAAQCRLNICSDNILTGAPLMGVWRASMCLHTYYLYENEKNRRKIKVFYKKFDSVLSSKLIRKLWQLLAFKAFFHFIYCFHTKSASGKNAENLPWLRLGYCDTLIQHFPHC